MINLMLRHSPCGPVAFSLCGFAPGCLDPACAPPDTSPAVPRSHPPTLGQRLGRRG